MSTINASSLTYTPRTDSEAAALVKRNSWEPRPDNNVARTSIPTNEGGGSQSIGANSYYPTDADLTKLATYYPVVHNSDKPTGRHGLSGTPTTSEIIEWGAWKWNWDEDWLRAQCVLESNWNQHFPGDWSDTHTMYMSYGIAQNRINKNGQVGPNWNGTFPVSRDCTAMAVDLMCHSLRYYYDGTAGQEGLTPDPAGNMRDSIARWYHGWSAIDYSETGYLALVENHYNNRTWEQAGF